MEKVFDVFEQMREIKAVLPPAKRWRVVLELAESYPTILLMNHTDCSAGSDTKITAKDIEEIKNLDFVVSVSKCNTRCDQINIVTKR